MRRPPRSERPSRSSVGRPRPDAPREVPRPSRPSDAEEGSEGILVGRRPVMEALTASASVERIMVAEDAGAWSWFLREGADLARSRGVPVVRVPRVTLDRLAPGVAHQGIAARVTDATFRAFEDLLRDAPAPALLLLADGVEDPRNLGAIVRSAAAAGAGGLLVPERRSAPLGPACAKASAGTLRLVPLAHVKNPTRALEALAEAGVWSVGLAAGERPLWEVDLVRPTCLVLGGEGMGLSRLVRERCDVLAGLPLAPGVDSLNVAVAAGVALFEALRQRRRAAEPR